MEEEEDNDKAARLAVRLEFNAKKAKLSWFIVVIDPTLSFHFKVIYKTL
jgi:hypothetical protein